jgi:Family of unknown function (DUF6084)
MTATSAASGPSAIPRLGFAAVDAGRLEHAAVPTLRFALRVEALERVAIRSILLDTQIQIAARRRGYEDAEADRLFELFGHARDWGTTLRTLLWTRVTTVVPPFEGTTTVALDVSCSYDLDVVAARYLDALGDGTVPLELLFSGTVFYAGPGGILQAGRISWEAEAEYALPVRVWRETMDAHFPGTAWLRLPKRAHERLCAFKSRRALAGWDDVVDALLGEGDE